MGTCHKEIQWQLRRRVNEPQVVPHQQRERLAPTEASPVSLAMQGRCRSGEATRSATTRTPMQHSIGLLAASTRECRNRHLQMLGPTGPEQRSVKGT